MESIDYGSITDESETNAINDISFLSSILNEFQIYSSILIYIAYLQDGNGFTFFLRCLTQSIIYSIPTSLTIMNTLEYEQLIGTRINVVKLTIVPYIFLNTIISLLYHIKWIYAGTNTPIFNLHTPISEYINSITNTTLDNAYWIHNNIFLDFIGQSTLLQSQQSLLNTIYQVCIDMAVFCSQLATFQLLIQRFNSQCRPMISIRKL